MESNRWQRIKEVYQQALDVDKSERREFVADSCGDDAHVAAEVMKLLDVPTQGSDDIDEIVDAATESFSGALSPGERVGAYRVLDVIGTGGMGHVYLAERADSEFEQRVAIKTVNLGFASPSILERFQLERQILADLEHNHIARLLDGGRTEAGVPYLVMEYIDGKSIVDYCTDEALALDERLDLFLKICDAVQYAHRKLIVHRDIKPSNILVTTDGIPKLLDFGVAKLLDASGDTALTRAEGRILTPEYASPEQVLGEAVTTSTDVYGLGVLLYQLISGAKPFDLGTATSPEIRKLICHTDPIEPSKAAAEKTADVVGRRIGGDLDRITMKAIRKEPERRYETARDLSSDIRNFQSGLPVSAREPSWTYRSRKFIQRNRTAVVGVAAATLAAIAMTVFHTARLTEERDRANLAAREAEEVATFLSGLFEVAAPDQSRGAEITARELLDRGAEGIGTELSDEPAVQAALMLVIGTAYVKLGLYDTATKTLESALATRESLGGLDDATLGDILHNLGVVYQIDARHDQAAELLQRALAVRRAVHGPSHTNVAATLSAHASLASELAQHDDAAAYLDEAEAIVFALEPAEPLAEADVLLSRGDLLAKLGDYDTAVASYRRVLEIRIDISGQDHPDTLVAQRSLADALFRAGHYGEAETLMREIVEIRRRVLGPEHTDLAHALNTLAIAIKQQGRFSEALPLHQEAYNIMSAAHPGDHPDVSVHLANLASLYYNLGEFDRSLELHEAAVAMKRRLFGDDHPSLADSYNNLAAVLADLGDYAGALEMYQRTLEIDSGSLGEDHPYVHFDRVGIGVMQGMLGQLEEAEGSLRTALANIQRVSGEDHPLAYNAMRELGIVLYKADRCDEADPVLAEALPGLEAAFTNDAWEVSLARVFLGACRVLTDPVAGESLLRQGYERLVTIRGPDSRLTRQARRLLTEFLRSTDRGDEALMLEQAAANSQE